MPRSARAMLARASGLRRCELLHVMPEFALAPDLEQRAAAAVEGALEELAGEMRGTHGLACSPHVRSGAVVPEIARAAAEYDLVALGAHGEHPLRDLVLGSSAQRLLRLGTSPVLVVKRPPEGPYRRVLAPVDFSADSEAAVSLDTLPLAGARWVVTSLPLWEANPGAAAPAARNGFPRRSCRGGARRVAGQGAAPGRRRAHLQSLHRRRGPRGAGLCGAGPRGWHDRHGARIMTQRAMLLLAADESAAAGRGCAARCPRGAGFVVMGTGGLGAAHHAFIGSVALAVAGQADVPVLLVP